MEMKNMSVPLLTTSWSILLVFIFSSSNYSPWTVSSFSLHSFFSSRTFHHVQPIAQRHCRSHPPIVSPLHETPPKKSSSSQNIQRPANEFSRPISTDKFILTRREYSMQIEANSNELYHLAQRFSLSNITTLRADLILTRGGTTDLEYKRGSPRPSSSSSSCIQVEGTIQATCVQTCVRTNEDFDVDLEFPIFALVRSCSRREQRSSSVSSSASMDRMTRTNPPDNKVSNTNERKKKGMREFYKQQYPTPPPSQQKVRFTSMDEMGVRQLQDIMNEASIEDDIIEDEAIYGQDGLLDVGELVAQLFRVKLDPFPKKKGTQPVFYSITG